MSNGAQTRLVSIILAAGQGTRMKSERAKVLFPLAGEPLVACPLRLAFEVGADPVVLVIGHQREVVRERVGALFPGRATFAEQLEQKGTGHAVMQAMKVLEGRLSDTDRVLILYGDVPLLGASTIRELMSLGERHRLALVSTVVSEPKGYGRIVRSSLDQVERIVEEKDATENERKIQEINAGIYLVEAKFLASALARLRNDNAQNEYYLTDLVALAIADGHEVGTVIAKDSAEVLGVNNRRELAQLDAIVRRRVLDKLMAEGVSITDPEHTYISARATIGRDTTIEPGVHIRGNTVIGAGCIVDVGAVITDSKIGDNVEIRPYTVLENAEVKASALIGPFSRLRPGAEIGEAAHVGNFVEVKNTKLGKGAKANHLAYLGDASIGAKSNIGAGTITCNYDGFGKYQTTIGENVFIGSNATLVAPLAIGTDAYVAAGSTITDAVGESDLAFGRARQQNKQGRAEEIRKRGEERARQAKAQKKG